MKQLFAFCLAVSPWGLISSCIGQDSMMTVQENPVPTVSRNIIPVQYQHILGINQRQWEAAGLQVAGYVRNILEDKQGNLWFGTNQEGVVKLTQPGKSNGVQGTGLTYFSASHGMAGNQVTATLEDRKGRLWCGTTGGVSVFDGPGIINYSVKDGLPDNGVWSLFQDSRGTIWAGTLKGVCRFNGKKFVPFQLPATTVARPVAVLARDRVSAIAEDKNGNLWFGTDGGGAFRFTPDAGGEGGTFTNFTRDNGLCGNNIACILSDSRGNLWFGSMDGGLGRYDGSGFSVINTQSGIGDNEVVKVYEDKAGNIWFSSEGYGVYRYNPGNGSNPAEQKLLNAGDKNFTRFGEEAGLNIKAVQSIYEDSKGRLWIGGGGGLYRFDGKDGFFNVTRDGLVDGC